VRYITTQPSLTKTSIYSRAEFSSTQGGGIRVTKRVLLWGGPWSQDKFGARLSVWYRKDGGWIDRIDPLTLATVDEKANHDETVLVRLAGLLGTLGALVDHASIYYQDRARNDHLHVLAAVLGSGRAPLRQRGSLAGAHRPTSSTCRR